MAAPSARLSTPSVTLDHNKWPELAADRLAWRAMLRSGVPGCPPAFRAPPPTPAALPIALTRSKRTALTATNAAILNSRYTRTLRRRGSA